MTRHRGVPRTRLRAILMIVLPALGTAGAVTLWIARGPPAPAIVAVMAATYIAGAIGVEVGFHRYFSHRAFKTYPPVRRLLGILGSIAGQGPVLFWAALHRQHHRYSDTAEDPHSPAGGGLAALLDAHVGWMLKPRALDFGQMLPDLMRDPVTIAIHRQYPAWFAFGLALPAVAGFASAGPWGALEGLLWGGWARIFLNHHVTWSINSVCHLIGRQPYATGEGSRNFAPLCLLSMGGSWHNNHHAFPYSATNDFRWWQLDPGAWAIRLAERAGLVWDVRMPRSTARVTHDG